MESCGTNRAVRARACALHTNKNTKQYARHTPSKTFSHIMPPLPSTARRPVRVRLSFCEALHPPAGAENVEVTVSLAPSDTVAQAKAAVAVRNMRDEKRKRGGGGGGARAFSNHP